MKEQHNIQVVQQMYAALRQGHPPMDFFAEDIEFYVPGSKERIPFAGTRYGQEQVAQLWFELSKLMVEAIELQQLQPQEFIAQDNQVVVLGYSIWCIRSNNSQVKYDWVQVFTLRNSKVIKVRESYDTATVEQLFSTLKIGSR
jgi:ketosteroid isomerase-like protein